jgi:flavin reductase (DIM6/NTAB) family NADH-FMN oxidoreductase RutF
VKKKEVDYRDFLKETFEVLKDQGLLLASVDRAGKPNAMAIGWATIGEIWWRPIFIVLVRPSRYTYELIEATGDFTVNVPPKELAEITAFCGSVSGRTHDKFAEKGLVAIPGRFVKSPIIDQCVINYECRVVHKNDIIPDFLSPQIKSSAYPSGDFHRVYFGEILAVYADEDARERIRGPESR